MLVQIACRNLRLLMAVRVSPWSSVPGPCQLFEILLFCYPYRMAKMEIVGELFEFLWARKLWWMVPITLFLLFIGVLLVFSESSAVAPFIYAIF